MRHVEKQRQISLGWAWEDKERERGRMGIRLVIFFSCICSAIISSSSLLLLTIIYSYNNNNNNTVFFSLRIESKLPKTMNLATNCFTASSVVSKTHNYRYSCRYDHHPHKTFSLLHHRTHLSKLSTSTSVRTAVAAVNSSDPVKKEQASSNKYYFVVANAKFMLDEEEHFQEQLAERIRLYGEHNLEQDFWLVIEPKFLDKFPNFTKRLKRPAVALVSTNGPWITFMKLRLDRVLCDSYEADSLEEALASNPVNLEFEKPENWVAPYPKYESGWWEPFLPASSEKQKV